MTWLPRRVAVSPSEQQVTGDAVAALAVNQNDPAHVTNRLDAPRDFIKSALHVSGEALLLLG